MLEHYSPCTRLHRFVLTCFYLKVLYSFQIYVRLPIAKTALLKNMIVNKSMQAMRKPGEHFQTVQQQDLHVHDITKSDIN